jgi:hypothetical protein
MRVRRVDARRGEFVPFLAVEQNIARGASQVSTFYQDRSRAQLPQLAGGFAHFRLAVDFHAGQDGGFVKVRRNQRRPRKKVADDGLPRAG